MFSHSKILFLVPLRFVASIPTHFLNFKFFAVFFIKGLQYFVIYRSTLHAKMSVHVLAGVAALIVLKIWSVHVLAGVAALIALKI